MPRFFFHVQDGSDFPDLQGTELTDFAAARREALRFASALLADHDAFWDSGEWTMRVTDAVDLTLFQLTFFSVDSAAALELKAHEHRRSMQPSTRSDA